MEYMGYTVEPQGGGAFAYLLTGKRGAQYGLLRYRQASHLMYVVRARTGVICGLKGNYTFTDEGGMLRARS